MTRAHLVGLRPALLALLLGSLAFTGVPASAFARPAGKQAAARSAKKKQSKPRAKKKTTRAKPKKQQKKKSAEKPKELPAEPEAVSMPALDLDAPQPESKKQPQVVEIAPQPAAPVAAEAVSAPVERRAKAEGTLFELGAGVRIFRRDFTVGDPLSRATPTYALDLAPAPFIAAELFPGHGLIEAIPPPLGIGASFEHAVGISSEVIAGDGAVLYPTRAHALQLELLGRLALSRWELTGRAGYGWRSFSISDAAGGIAKPRIPSIRYDHLSAAGRVRFQLAERLHFTAHAGARRLLGTGELGSQDYFPGTSGFGVTAGGGLGLALGPIEARLAVDLERYFLALDPLDQASGSDQYLGVSLSAAWRG